MVEGTGKLVKFLMLVINFILLMSGIALVVFGIWTLIDKSFFQFLIGENKFLVTASVLFIIIGILSFFISLIGFCGAYKEIRCLLIVYFAFIFIIFCLVIASIVLAFIFRSEIDERMSTEVYNSINKYGEDTSVTEAWDVVQKTFKCCGVTTNTGSATDPPYKSWEHNKNFTGGTSKVPFSCCKDPKDTTCNTDANLSSSIYQEDCFEKLKSYFKEHSVTLCAIAIFVAVLLLIAMTLSCSLFCMITS